MSTQISKEQADLIEVLSLLEESFKGKETKKINEAKNRLQQILEVSNGLSYGITLLLEALKINSFNNKTISLDIHKSIVIYLKNIFFKNNTFNSEELFGYLINIMNILFMHRNNNPNLSNPIIINVFQNIISIILSSKSIIEKKNQNYLEQILENLLKILKSETKENFLQTAKIGILLTNTLLGTKSANGDNYEQILENYYMPIVNIIFSNVSNYIDPKNNIYNNEFIVVLKLLFDGFYSNLTKTRSFYNATKRKEIASKFFKEYGSYSFELIQIMPLFDEETAKKYGKPNPIIVFNIDEDKYSEMNHMKSKAIQFLSFITQVSTLEEKNMEEEKDFINDKELVELINKIIVLIVKTFEDILNNKEKYFFLRKYKEDMKEEDDSYNILLFQICVFLTRCLVREPIKTEFSVHMKQFLLNILFPMIVTVIEDEENFLEIEPDLYHNFMIDISNVYKIKNFRTSGCFLVNKICEKYVDIKNFVLSFCLEMFNYIISEGNIQNEFAEYNVYLKYIKDALINRFNDIIKLDFALLIFLILKEKIKDIQYYITRLRDIFIKNQAKIHLISSPIIKIKLCKIYLYFLPVFFDERNGIKEKEVRKQFIENAINYLLINIIQENNRDNIQALSYEASETIVELLTLSRRNEEYKLLASYISQNLEKNFSVLNSLIEKVDAYSFFLVIDQILSNIEIKERNLLFICLSNLSKKYQKNFLSQNREDQLFCTQYFSILNSFLCGKNKLKAENKEEINKFNEIFDPILNYIKNPKKFSSYEELVSITEEYIKAVNGINERSALVLKSMKMILEKEQTTSDITFNFVSTFLLNIQKNISDEPLDQKELFNEILTIINMSFSFVDDTLENSKISALLLSLEVLNLNPNLSEEVFKDLIIKSLDSFLYVEIEDTFPNERNNVNQLSLANVSLGFIFKTELTFKILQNQKFTLENKEKQKCEMTYFDKYINLIMFLFNIYYPDYNPVLGKCIILGICGILSNKACLNYLDANMEKKVYIIKTFVRLVIKHKNEKNIILSKLMKKEMKCNFIESESEEEDEEEEDEIDEEFNEKVDLALSTNNNINSCDEFKFFSGIMMYIKENNIDIYNHLSEQFTSKNKNHLEELLKTRNIKITYNQKEFTVPRKTVKIIRMNK
jgi:hypothetical protein